MAALLSRQNPVATFLSTVDASVPDTDQSWYRPALHACVYAACSALLSKQKPVA